MLSSRASKRLRIRVERRLLGGVMAVVAMLLERQLAKRRSG
jgi:hypothetical protein